MCLVTKQEKPIILEKDMTVYKSGCISDENFKSEKFNFAYEWEKLNIINMVVDNVPMMYFDSLVAKMYFLETKFEETVDLTHVHQGFHSALSIKRLDDLSKVVNCTIPKGSKVFLDETGLVVSNRIILHKPTKNETRYIWK